MASSGMLRRVALVRTDVSEELSASFIRVTRFSELGTTLPVTSNRQILHRFLLWGGYSSTQTATRNAADQEDQATVYPSRLGISSLRASVAS
jgi:hypothetical protein